ncbi:CMGC/CK2 protein kinase [Thecamonas trahens ATCC 50062]|uniref:non-specific serine/threonine protein kinase n=1 Tax=Thecamonas trahens ATCC 50062 TaxID=461836 RepID=A0A0L0D5R2_THETB|nr:CMGC/CK2 protein kinase [Thecamonas trahens ATCC 50062]KNC47707.1 CMGC/CK2 protein kinase [Thecamonas trahens ATCC 50062]|eukprot:XP_013759189.1 CMGC/CK2 protein kinase [Thecamonas trahens ATCC 50062]
MMSPAEAKVYMFRLFEALNATHAAGIMHRDVKCANVLFERKTGSLRLIDWGLATWYVPNEPATKWAGTRRWKAPESVVHYPFPDYASDMWSAGCIMAVLFFQCNWLQQHDSNEDHMVNVIQYLGADDYDAWLNRYFITKSKWSLDYLESVAETELPRKRFAWYKLVRTQRVLELATPLAIDLIDRVLVFDHEKRLTAHEAMHHPFFDDVRADLLAASKKAARAGRGRGACCASSAAAAGPKSGGFKVRRKGKKSKAAKSKRKKHSSSLASGAIITLAEVDLDDYAKRLKVVKALPTKAAVKSGKVFGSTARQAEENPRAAAQAAFPSTREDARFPSSSSSSSSSGSGTGTGTGTGTYSAYSTVTTTTAGSSSHTKPTVFGPYDPLDLDELFGHCSDSFEVSDRTVELVKARVMANKAQRASYRRRRHGAAAEHADRTGYDMLAARGETSVNDSLTFDFDTSLNNSLHYNSLNSSMPFDQSLGYGREPGTPLYHRY